MSELAASMAPLLRPARKMNGVDLAAELQKIYASEINVRIGWFWDCGIEVRLGDEMNGYLAEENVRTVDEIVPWLQEAIAHFYPHSTYAASLDPELTSRAATRLFGLRRSAQLPSAWGAD